MSRTCAATWQVRLTRALDSSTCWHWHRARGQPRIDSAAAAGDRAILFDVLDEASLIEVGRLIWENRETAPFAVASSGLQYALVAYWRSAGLLTAAERPSPASEADRLAVLSGSCSPETAASIEWALENGYEGIRLDAPAVASGKITDALEQSKASRR